MGKGSSGTSGPTIEGLCARASLLEIGAGGRSCKAASAAVSACDLERVMARRLPFVTKNNSKARRMWERKERTAPR